MINGVGGHSPTRLLVRFHDVAPRDELLRGCVKENDEGPLGSACEKTPRPSMTENRQYIIIDFSVVEKYMSI